MNRENLNLDELYSCPLCGRKDLYARLRTRSDNEITFSKFCTDCGREIKTIVSSNNGLQEIFTKG
jgi:transcription elongation factor Elf1